MADELRVHESNPNGHWERWEIVTYHDRILGVFDRDYYSPNHALALPSDWWSDRRVREIRDELIVWLRSRMDDRYRFGFKDPRTCRLLPLWHEVFAELDIEPNYVLCFRDPRQIVRSVAARDGFDGIDTEYRYVTYYAHAIAGVGTSPPLKISYDSWFAHLGDNLERVVRFLDLSRDPGDGKLLSALGGVIDRDLRHDPEKLEASPTDSLATSLHRLLLQDVRQDGFGDELKAMAATILGMEALAAPIQDAAARWRAYEKDLSAAALAPATAGG